VTVIFRQVTCTFTTAEEWVQFFCDRCIHRVTPIRVSGKNGE